MTSGSHKMIAIVREGLAAPCFEHYCPTCHRRVRMRYPGKAEVVTEGEPDVIP